MSKAATTTDYHVADLALADEGRLRVEWALGQMPVMEALKSRFASEQPFAGITIGAGRVTTTAANATIEGRVAWVLVDYRWVNPAERRAEVGRATIICERRGERWKIVHAHSSQPLPWEP